MDDSFFNILHLLEALRYDLISVSSNTIWAAQLIGSIGALLYFAGVSYKVMLGEGRLLSLKHFRPFALLFCILAYPLFMSVIDGIAMSANNSLGGSHIYSGSARITDVLMTRDLNPETENDDNLVGIEQIHTEQSTESASLLQQATDALNSVSETLSSFSPTAIVKWVGDNVYWALMRFLEEILFRISHAILIIINTIRVFFLVVLYIIGPLVLGISIVPGFESSFQSWLARYMSVHLWLGLGNVYEALAVRLFKIFQDNGGISTNVVSLATQGAETVMLNRFSMVFLLTVIVGYITIPTVANWLVSSSGISQAGGAFQNLAMTAFRAKQAGVGKAPSPNRYRRD